MRTLAVLCLLIPSVCLASDWNMGIERRVSTLESEFKALDKRVGKLENPSLCDCALTGKCDCIAGKCKCKDCPLHSKPVWKDSYTCKGTEFLFFTSKSCIRCPAAESDLSSLSSKIAYIDCTDGNDHLADHFKVDEFPTLLKLEDGVVVNRCVGDSCRKVVVDNWLKVPVRDATAKNDFDQNPGPSGGDSFHLNRYSGRSWTHPPNLREHLIQEHRVFAPELSRMSYSQLKTVHDNVHNTGNTGIVTSSTGRVNRRSTSSYSYPAQRRVSYPVQRHYQNFTPRVSLPYSNCPSCVR